MPHSDVDRRIRELTSMDDVQQAAELLRRVWSGEASPLSAHLLRALAHSGNYVAGTFDSDTLVAVAVAFFGPPADKSMHSHVTGVLPGFEGRGLGRSLKEHQRAWALERGVQRITWTFDPLIARNAHFNVNVLGAGVTDYLIDHYGSMDDATNRGDASDRLLAVWELRGSAPRRSPDAPVATVRVPTDVQAVRLHHPEEAARWRTTVREQLVGHFAAGLTVGGFDERGYLLV